MTALPARPRVIRDFVTANAAGGQQFPGLQPPIGLRRIILRRQPGQSEPAVFLRSQRITRNVIDVQRQHPAQIVFPLPPLRPRNAINKIAIPLLIRQSVRDQRQCPFKVIFAAMPAETGADGGTEALHPEADPGCEGTQQSPFVRGQRFGIEFAGDFSRGFQRDITRRQRQQAFQLRIGQEVRRTAAEVERRRRSGELDLPQTALEFVEVGFPLRGASRRHGVKRAVSAFRRAERHMNINMAPGPAPRRQTVKAHCRPNARRPWCRPPCRSTFCRRRAYCGSCF
ncbi:hypothetical protein SDC9_119435 [bioreactor metagenome]|uniref:Uncharacterized protein n=1 Tax=bioreactor metagenome TaxID=1076179 RepID=A0A645C498_9ZZZZ